ncbi:class I SAM-dependent methyltransferase [candidate division KSB1 bacterium]|nr:class I SAM-dependent methyltransferase [candidate division KSB1 bacterium]
MNCCAVSGTNSFFNSQARHYEKYFRKKGLRKEQKYLAEGIQQRGIAQADLLEIGCGVGGLHLRLLQKGAGRATGFDISERMLASARQLSTEMGLAAQTQYWQGDFVALHDNAPAAEITILDKVLCCYADVRELIARSTAKTRRIYAVSYPRDNVFVRNAFRAAILFFKLFRVSFHPFYHSPAEIMKRIMAEGFEQTYERHTGIWIVQVFQRKRA